MGDSVASQRLQVRRQTLSLTPALVVSVVPDVSGLDREFDYAVPENLRDAACVGARVRVPLHGRTVTGWIVGIGSSGAERRTFELAEVMAVTGSVVDPSVVPLTAWIAGRWFGPRRAVLASASAPRVKARQTAARRGQVRKPSVDSVAVVAEEVLRSGGGLIVVPPLASALSAVEVLARRGPVIVSCPTHRMARLGAASLRRRGLTTAELPDQWDAALAGVDVVIGARSAVLGPCRDLAGMVVVDEHDEAMKEERSPAWDALSVAVQRCRSANLPLFATSPTPSAAALRLFGESVHRPEVERGWPEVLVEDLSLLAGRGSLLGSALLETARKEGSSVGCVGTAKGGARLLACTACRLVQLCESCGSALRRDDSGVLACTPCGTTKGSVCTGCGRTSLAVLRGGTSHFRSELSRSTGREVLEITNDAPDDWIDGRLFVGTEALLRRLGTLDAVVFIDADRELSAGAATAPREFLSKVALAARMVGRSGRVVIQTRQPGHPLLRALSSADPGSALAEWMETDMNTRASLGLPPFSTIVRVTLKGPSVLDTQVLEGTGVDVAIRGEEVLLRTEEPENLRSAVEALRHEYGSQCRVHAEPWRY